MVLPADRIRNSFVPASDEVTDYYKANTDQFMTTEQVVIDYIVLNKNDIAKTVNISPEAINEEYQYRVEQLSQQADGKTQVSVILVQTNETRSLEQARQRVNEVLEKLQSGVSFSKLAKLYSDDPLTAKKGGDLGLVQAGFFGDQFDNTIANLEVGDVSAPIETDFGIQILKVTSRNKADIPSLDRLSADIEQALKENEVDSLFLQQSRQLVDISFESSDLTQPAEKLGLSIKTSEPFDRRGTKSGITQNQLVVTAAFSDDVLNLGSNSDLIETAPEQAVVLRVREHKEPKLKPFHEVKSDIITDLKKIESEKQIAVLVEEILTALHAGKSLKSIADEHKLNVVKRTKAGRNALNTPTQLLGQVFKMPHPGKGMSYDSVSLPRWGSCRHCR